jgi:hypothetical protein
MPNTPIVVPAITEPIDRLALGIVDVRGIQPAQGFSMDCYCMAEE